jgi:hypothetical protein
MSRNKILFSIGLLFFFVSAWYYQDYETKRILQKGIKTTALITKAGTNITVSFKANSLIYNHVLSKPYSNLFSGEAYIVAYDFEDPKSSVMLFWQPVFNKQQYIMTTATEANKLFRAWGNETIAFDYEAFGEVYTRYQELIPNKKFPAKQEVKVFYNRLNPRIAYIEY